MGIIVILKKVWQNWRKSMDYEENRKYQIKLRNKFKDELD